MTPNERELILKVADGLRTADRSAIDPEADRLIRAEVAGQPNAAYLLTQRVAVQDLALARAQTRIDELEARLRQAGLAPSGGGGSFLGGASGAAGATGPSAYPPQVGYPPGNTGPVASGPAASSGGGVGSFLKTAAAAAVGTIGGQLIFDGVRHLAAEHGGGGLGGLFPGGHMATDSYRESVADDTPGGGFIPDDRPSRSTQDWGGGGDFAGGQTEEADPIDDPEDEVEEDTPADESDDDPGDSGGGNDW